VARWGARRSETVAAVREALFEGWLEEAKEEALDISAERRMTLAGLLHKLAGTAALFDEPELGEAAATLERALTQGGGGAGTAALAEALLDVAAAPQEAQAALLAPG
jgi:two-component system, sensor histidine kinase